MLSGLLISHSRPLCRSPGRAACAATFFWLCAIFAGCNGPSLEQEQVRLVGAGATFPAPLYEQWFREIGKTRPDSNVRYDGVGSRAGVEQFIDELVDFAASDDPLTGEVIAQVDRGVCQIPMTSGALVISYNVSDTAGNVVSDLNLSRQAYAGIFLGTIRNWNDIEITKHNPGLVLPDQPIHVIYRLDPSTSTSVFTRHLSAISDAFKSNPGSSDLVNWPVGSGMPREVGVVRGLRQVPGSIGYLSLAFAEQQKLPTAILENKSGNFIEPSLESAEVGLRSQSWMFDEPSFYAIDPEQPEAYPIVTYSWIQCYRIYDDPKKLELLKQMLAYGLRDGQRFSADLGYVPLSSAIAERAMSLLETITLPQSADTATSLPATTNDSEPSVIAPAAKEDAEGKSGQAGSAAAPAPSSADIRADDVSVQEAAGTEPSPQSPSTRQDNESSTPEAEEDTETPDSDQPTAACCAREVVLWAMIFNQPVRPHSGDI
jgi:phosphate transport system substrate-binding protein